MTTKVISGYQLFLTNPQATSPTICFPVNPAKIMMKYQGDHKVYDILDIGEVVVARLPKLATYEWDAFFPATDNDAYVNDNAPQGFQPPAFFINFLQQCMSQRALCRFILQRRVAQGDVTATFDTNTQVIVTSFDTDERGGEPGDVYYKLCLLEYRPFAPALVNLATVNGKTTATTIPQRASDTSVIMLNTPVIVNGACYFAPDGSDVVTKTAANMAGTVVQINKGSAYPYQIIDQDGNTLGWTNHAAIVAAATPWGK